MKITLEEKARAFAEAAHEGQVRKGTTIPYITHPIAVAGFVKQVGGSKEQVAAAFLHDVLEDCSISEAEIRRKFGADVLRIVKGCTEENKSLRWHARKSATLERLKTADLDVLLVSCADKLHNLESTLNDFEKIGNKLWKRFKVGEKEQVWYYTELGHIFEKRMPKAWIKLWYMEKVQGLLEVTKKSKEIKGSQSEVTDLWLARL